MDRAWIDGKAVTLKAAIAEAAKLLGASRFPLIAGLGAVAQATGMGMGAMHHGGMTLSADASPADVSAHVDHMLKHLYVEIDATPAQQAQIGPLLQPPRLGADLHHRQVRRIVDIQWRLADFTHSPRQSGPVVVAHPSRAHVAELDLGFKGARSGPPPAGENH